MRRINVLRCIQRQIDMKPVIILGAGGHATVLLDILQLLGREIQGICDPKLESGSAVKGIPIVSEMELERNAPNDIELVNTIGSVRSLELRIKIFEKYKHLGYTFASVIHPTAILAKEISLGEGVQIMAGAIIQPKASIGDNTIVNTRAVVEHDCDIGSSVHVAPGVILCGGVRVGEGTHIGVGAVIIQNICIGKGALIGANTTVLKNVSDRQRVITRKQEII